MDTMKLEEIIRKLIDASTFNWSVLIWLAAQMGKETPYTQEMVNEQMSKLRGLLEEARSPMNWSTTRRRARTWSG